MVSISLYYTYFFLIYLLRILGMIVVEYFDSILFPFTFLIFVLIFPFFMLLPSLFFFCSALLCSSIQFNSIQFNFYSIFNWKFNIFLIFHQIVSSLIPVTVDSRSDPGSEGGVRTGQPTVSSISPALTRGQRRIAQSSELQVSRVESVDSP